MQKVFASQSISITKEVKTIDNRLIDRVHNDIKRRLDDDTYDRPFTKKILERRFSEAEIMNVIEYCVRNATRSKGRAFVKIFSNKMGAM